MTVRVNSQDGIQSTGYHVTKEAGAKSSDSLRKMLFGESTKVPTPREQYQAEVLTLGKPLITRGLTRIVNGQEVTTPTNEPLSQDEIKKTLKRKDLDKDTRLLYNLELKRQQQGGHLTEAQGKQWVDLQNRQTEKHMAKMKNILKNGF